MNGKGKINAALKAAFPYTVPVMAGYLFLGMTYGIFARASGLGAIFPVGMSAVVFAGSAEFLMVSLLREAFDPVKVFFVIFLLNARHLFYGISMLEKYRGTGFKKWYLIFGLTDETFSVVYTAQPPAQVDKGWFMLFITLMDHSYWMLGAACGALFGSLIRFNTEGLDFVMTAMFTVILINQWQKSANRAPILIGVLASVLCLVLLGAEDFLLPAMALMLLLLTLLRKRLSGEAAV